MPKETKSESWEKGFDEKFKCINNNCDNNGCIPVLVSGIRQISETECEQTQEWEAEQCQFCYEYRFPIKSFIRSQRQKDRDSLVEMVRSKDKEICHCDEEQKVKGSGCPHLGYLRMLADLEQVINKIMK